MSCNLLTYRQMLTDTAARQAKPRKKPYKLADSGGPYLLVKAAGKYWRMDYRFAGKRKTLAIGVYLQLHFQMQEKNGTKQRSHSPTILTRR